jgi:hypothetical protein
MNDLRWAFVVACVGLLHADQPKIASVACTCTNGGNNGTFCSGSSTGAIGYVRADCLATCVGICLVPISGFSVDWAVTPPYAGTGSVQGQQVSNTGIETSGALLLTCGLRTVGDSGYDYRDCLGGASGNSFRLQCP